MKTLSIITCLLISASFGHAQVQVSEEASDSTTHADFVNILYLHRDRSYITAGGGFGNVEPLMFEGRLSPGFVITLKNKNSALLLNPQITTRMDHKRSFPINSPSYKANLLYLQGIDSWSSSSMSNILYDHGLWFAGISHFSNGGAGSFYSNKAERIVNFDGGSFSTDFAVLGISSYQTRKTTDGNTAMRLAKASMEYHFPNKTTEDMLQVYGRYRFQLAWKAAGVWNEAADTWLKKLRQHSGIEVQTGWIAGSIIGVANDNATKRWTLDVSYHYYPSWFDEISFFVRFYRGQDYYNIYFVNTIHLLNFGINANLMHPAQVVKTIGKKKVH